MEIKQELAQVQERPDDAAPVECPASNVAAMRDALKACIEAMCRYCRMEAGRDRVCVHGCETLKMAKAALAAAPRQCDIGTDNEQIRRWKEFCDHYEIDRSPESFARWAQGPHFEEGGAK